ncbi:MAG: hypothetical protein WCC26_09520 [Terracidiphilus sp.]
MIPFSAGVVSLFDMQQFFADVLNYQISALYFGEAKLGFEKDENRVLPAAGAMVYAKLNIVQALFDSYGMTSSASQCRRVVEKIEVKGAGLLCGELREGLKQLRERFEDELKAQFFLHLEPKQAAQFNDPTKEWSEISARFNKTKYNIEESGKCFALERYGAAVFHVLQVAEYGVIQIGGLMGVLGDKPGWSCVARLQKLIVPPYPERIPLAQQHSKLLENTLPLVAAIKDSWRHKLEHVDNQITWVESDFSPSVAEEIISATRGFMRKLASELPK